MSKINVIFGGATIGDPAAYPTAEKLQSALDVLSAHGFKSIDTAPVYPVFAPGDSEKILGDSKATEKGFHIETKIQAGGPGSLKPETIRQSLTRSLESLGVKKVHLLYCHTPDYETPLVDTARTFDELYKEGKFDMWGISNFATEMVGDLLRVCKENGFVPPKVYQGHYNPVNRGFEKDLLPLLRENKIIFNAYSPLGGGFFTGNLTEGGMATDGTRYAPGNPMGDFQRKSYDKPVMHEAFKVLRPVLDENKITGPEASLRWIAHHSPLQEGDGIVVGSSKASQLEMNIKFIQRGPLPPLVAEAVSKMWQIVSSS